MDCNDLVCGSFLMSLSFSMLNLIWPWGMVMISRDFHKLCCLWGIFIEHVYSAGKKIYR